ncbi:hypothetical protein GC167_06695 [bacterium]|nr:hypothetical protein [bacterium]
MIQAFKKNWWIWTLRGLVFGLLVLATPINNVFRFLAFLFLGLGALELFLGIRVANMVAMRSFWFLNAAIDLGFAFFILFSSNSEEVYNDALGLWSILIGGFMLYQGFSLKQNRIIMLILGMVFVASGFILILDVLNDGTTGKQIAGLFTLIFGLFLSLYSFRWRPNKEDRIRWLEQDKERAAAVAEKAEKAQLKAESKARELNEASRKMDAE